MEWILISNRLPTFDDLPFVTVETDGKTIELWEDSDFFQELTENEQLDFKAFAIIKYVEPVVKKNMLIDDLEKIKVFNDWMCYRKDIKKPIRAKRTIEGLTRTFNENTVEECTTVVNHSIDNGYQGLFWNKTKAKSNANGWDD